MKIVVVKTLAAGVVKNVKNKLESHRLLDKSQKIVKDEHGFFIIPTSSPDFRTIQELLREFKANIFIDESDRIEQEIEINDITGFITSFLRQHNIEQDLAQTLLSRIPQKWSIYPPMLLISNHETFDSQEWQEFLKTIDSNFFFQNLLSSCFHKQNVTHIAVNKPIIEQDIMRRPFNLIPIYNDFGPEPSDELFENPKEQDLRDAFWCTVVQNGIIQTWAPRYTMFSRGNIKEKARILNTFTNVGGKTVVDLYAGIGYFTLSYLKLGAKHLFCFELNPWSIEGLKRGAVQNGFTYKVFHRGDIFQYDPTVNVFIFNESNEYAPERFKQAEVQLPITHINLGLLPTSEKAWPLALGLYKNNSSEQSCDLHIHENVSTEDLSDFIDELSFKLLQLEDVLVEPLHLEKIKTFAPGVWHICADLRVFRS